KPMRALLVIVSFVVVLGAAAAGLALGQSDNWFPSRWGAADQRGAATRITPAKVLEAKSMITKGNVYQLGRAYESAMPIFGTRHFSLRIPQAFGPVRSNKMIHQDQLGGGELCP